MLPSRIDWFRILSDLRDRGLTHCDVASEIGVPRTRVRDWYAEGASPRFDDGMLLIILWFNKCLVLDDTSKPEIIFSNPSYPKWLAEHNIHFPRKGR